jgi:hypothetical protein
MRPYPSGTRHEHREATPAALLKGQDGFVVVLSAYLFQSSGQAAAFQQI